MCGGSWENVDITNKYSEFKTLKDYLHNMLVLIIWKILVLMTFKIDNMGLDKIEKLHLLVTYDFAFKCGQDIYIY